MAEQGLGTELGNREFFIRRWTQEYPAFVDVCRALPAAKLDFRPHPDSRSAGELVALIVSVEQSCIELCSSGRTSYANSLQWHAVNNFTPLDEMIARYQNSHRILAEKLSSLDDTAWRRQAWLLRGKSEIMLKDTVGGLLWIALFDTVHHRGQLSTYLRPMGGKVPSIYGPSADAPEG
jgi:uncharacterized damage-inducible protein DinB